MDEHTLGKKNKKTYASKKRVGQPGNCITGRIPEINVDIAHPRNASGENQS